MKTFKEFINEEESEEYPLSMTGFGKKTKTEVSKILKSKGFDTSKATFKNHKSDNITNIYVDKKHVGYVSTKLGKNAVFRIFK